MNIKEQIETLREELRQHNYNYYIADNPSISDYEFDIKLKTLQDLESKPVTLTSVRLILLLCA